GCLSDHGGVPLGQLPVVRLRLRDLLRQRVPGHPQHVAVVRLDDGGWLAAVGDEGPPRRLPGGETTVQVDRLHPELAEVRRGVRGPVTGAAHDQRLLGEREVGQAVPELHQRDVRGPLDVAGCPLLVLADVEHQQALGQRVRYAGDRRRGDVHDPIPPGPDPTRCAYLSKRDIRRSARGLPPVWQVGQYCSDESAKLTSRTMSPQTGHFSPVRPWTARLVFFSLFSSLAASPRERSTASPSSSLIAANSWSSAVAVRLLAGLNGDILAACRISSL